MKKRDYLLYILIAIICILVILIFAKEVLSMKRLNPVAAKVEENEINIDTNNVKIEELSDYSVRANVPIFMYHWIKDDTGDYAYPENMVKPDELKKQMDYLHENNYDVIFVSELNSLQHYEKPVILTFDDGWEDVYKIAFPYAKELNMKFCMYIITDLVGTPGYCTIEELKEMKESGLVELDSHTLSHPYLNELSAEEVENELVGSKNYLKENLGVDSTVICYPSGRQNATVLNIVSENYNYGLLMDGGVFRYNSDFSNLYLIPRIYAMRSMTLDTFINYCETSLVNVI